MEMIIKQQKYKLKQNRFNEKNEVKKVKKGPLFWGPVLNLNDR